MPSGRKVWIDLQHSAVVGTTKLLSQAYVLFQFNKIQYGTTQKSR
jgi:hypothetical protein